MIINNTEIHGINNAYKRIKGLNVKNLNRSVYYVAELYINRKTGQIIVHYVNLTQDPISTPFLHYEAYKNFELVTTFSLSCEIGQIIQVLKTYLETSPMSI